MKISTIKLAVANAIRNDATLISQFITACGVTPQIFVNYYADEGAPSVDDSPFILITNDVEAETGEIEEDTQSFSVILGILSDSPAKTIVAERTASTAGLIVTGNEALLETLRDIIEATIATANIGATVHSISHEQSNDLDYPLEWVKSTYSIYSPNTL